MSGKAHLGKGNRQGQADIALADDGNAGSVLFNLSLQFHGLLQSQRKIGSLTSLAPCSIE
jgi:hypothetical protein